jgi:hypothetical protein
MFAMEELKNSTFERNLHFKLGENAAGTFVQQIMDRREGFEQFSKFKCCDLCSG